MNRKIWISILCGSICGLVLSLPAFAEEPSDQEFKEPSGHELNERLKKLEEKMSGGAAAWTDRITISGAVEAEAVLLSEESNGDTTDSSDIALSTVDVNLDVVIAKNVSGHVLFTYGDDEGMEVDDGYVTIDGKDVVPLYLMAGKIYVPFGNYETHMVSDPLTQDLGETVDGAIQFGFVNQWFDAALAIYNGDVNETGEEDDPIDSYVLSAKATLPEGAVPDMGLSAGVSYISNLADSGLSLSGDTIEDYVAGFGVFVSVSFKEFVFLEAEYIKALDKFSVGELTYDGGEESEPGALNIELACAPMEKLELAVRYGKTEDIKGGPDQDALVETQYGIAAAYSLFENTTLSLEYLKGEYENDDEVTLFTTLLSIEF